MKSRIFNFAVDIDVGEESIVATDGGRYDIYVSLRLRRSVYWDEPDCEVRRCSWFFKADSDARFSPYTEEFSETLEEHYKNAALTGNWHCRYVSIDRRKY